MAEIPKAPIARIMKQAGAERISEDAKDAVTEYLEQLTYDLTVEAKNVAKIAKRKTIKKEDIDLAINNL